MHRRRGIAVSVALLTFASAAAAEVKTKQIEYKQNGTVLQGLIAWDDATKGKRPGVLVVHEWWGHNEHARNQAKRLAEAGYVGFALDLYGKGKVATHPKDAEAFMKEATKDPAVIAARFNTALDQLKRDPHVDAEKIAAIGYCFGGGVVLEMVRAGADLDAVATFHGSLSTQTPAEKGNVKPRILVLTGAADPMVPPMQVEAFKKG
jgi:dienelactone hydrolase